MTRFFRICLGFPDVLAFFIIQDFEGGDMYTKYRLGSGFLTFRKCDGRRGKMPASVRCACVEWRGNVPPHS